MPLSKLLRKLQLISFLAPAGWKVIARREPESKTQSPFPPSYVLPGSSETTESSPQVSTGQTLGETTENPPESSSRVDRFHPSPAGVLIVTSPAVVLGWPQEKKKHTHKCSPDLFSTGSGAYTSLLAASRPPDSQPLGLYWKSGWVLFDLPQPRPVS